MKLQVVALLAALFLVETVKSATHVNISIGHQTEANPSDVTYVDGQAAAELRASQRNAKQQSDFSYHSNAANTNSDSNRLRFTSGGNKAFEYSRGSARLVAGNEKARMPFARQKQDVEFTSSGSEQDKQNQEFERYIQNYHSGPTVETVFESATPSTNQQQQQQKSSSTSSSTSVSVSSSNGGQSQRIVAIGSRPFSHQQRSFERQVALPAPSSTVTLSPTADDRQTHLTVNHQLKPASSVGDISSSSASSSSASGYDQSSYDQDSNNYNKPIYVQDEQNFQNQYPPDEYQDSNYGSGGGGGGGSGGGYYTGYDQSNYYGSSTPAPNYLPSYPRPLVTKTIQIAQPALKAKKYEIRHPAIQKEFYDIEERVVIKPAGTIVVELERPVAKIPKGETILPLGHPHPAVASAYNTNSATVVQTSDVVNGGSGGGGDNANRQFTPSPVYNPSGASAADTQYSNQPSISSTTVASMLTTTPSYDLSSKDDFVEANLNKQYNEDANFVTTTERSYIDDKQSNNDGFYATTTESSRDYGQHFYSRDETDRPYMPQTSNVAVKNNGAPVSSTTTSYAGNKPQTNFVHHGQVTYRQGSSQYQPNSNSNNNNNNNNNNQYKGEYFTNDYYSNQKAAKPARLQEQPRSSAVNGRSTQVVKHQHNIHLPPSQHNIYLGHLEQEPSFYGRQQQKAQLKTGSPRYNDEVAHVLELKPYLNHHPGSVVVYASATMRPKSENYNNYNNRYDQQKQQQQQQQQPYDEARYVQSQSRRLQYPAAGNSVQYSAPYSNMRYNPNQSVRYTYGSDRSNLYPDTSNNYNYNNNNNNKNNNYNKDNYQSDEPAMKTASGVKQHAHIQIEIPHHPHESNKPIVVSSTIRPVVQSLKEEEHISNENNDNNNDDSSINNDADVFDSSESDCDQEQHSGRYQQPRRGQQQFQRIVQQQEQPAVVKVQSNSVDVNVKGSAGHMSSTSSAGSRVIAATPAPTDANASSESFHKRRIVVNHPFQTVREVVEHEPITNYHQVQVNEPASPEFYHHTAPYYQQETHGALRQIDAAPAVVYHHQSATTHGNLHVTPAVHAVTVGYHHDG